MLKIRVKKEDAIYINEKKFIVSRVNEKCCEIWDKDLIYKIWTNGPQKIEGLEVHYLSNELNYANLGFDGDRNIKVESDNLHRKKNYSKLVRAFYGN